MARCVALLRLLGWRGVSRGMLRSVCWWALLHRQGRPCALIVAWFLVFHPSSLAPSSSSLHEPSFFHTCSLTWPSFPESSANRPEPLSHGAWFDIPTRLKSTLEAGQSRHTSPPSPLRRLAPPSRSPMTERRASRLGSVLSPYVGRRGRAKPDQISISLLSLHRSIVVLDVVTLLQRLQVCLPPRKIPSLLPCRNMVKHDEVSVVQVVPIQVIQSMLGVDELSARPITHNRQLIIPLWSTTLVLRQLTHKQQKQSPLSSLPDRLPIESA